MGLNRMLCALLLALLLSPGLAADGLRQGETATYAVHQGDQYLGDGGYAVTAADENGTVISGDITLSTPSGDVRMESVTRLAADGSVAAYRLLATLPNGSTQELEVEFEPGLARALILIGGSQREQTVELPDEWVLLDNNSPAHLALLASRLSPDMEPADGQVFVPQQLTLVGYTLEYAGEASYEIGGNEIPCRLYRMTLLGTIDVELYVNDGRLVAMEQPGQSVKFVLVHR